MSLRKKKPISRHISMVSLPTTSENGDDGTTLDLSRRVTKKPKRASWKKLSFAGFPRFNRHSPSSSSDGDGSAATSPTSPMSPGMRQELGKSPPPGYIYYGGALISRDPQNRNFQGASKVVGKAMSLDRNTGRVGRNNSYRQSDMALLDTSIDDEAVFSDSCPVTLSSRHKRVFSDPEDEALFNVILRGESRRESRCESRSDSTADSKGDTRREMRASVAPLGRVDRERTLSDGSVEPGWQRRRKIGFDLGREQLQVCYHSDCQERNGHHALMLCGQCDDSVHSGTTGHLRFNIPQKVSAGTSLQRNMSICSLPSPVTYQSKSDTEDEDTRTTRPGSADEEITDGLADVILNMKLRRKKALKGRRHHTEDALEMSSSGPALTLQPQHQRSQSLQDMDLSGSHSTWQVCPHGRHVSPTSHHDTKTAYFDMMLEELDKVSNTTAVCGQCCNLVGSHDAPSRHPAHAKTNSMPVSMASTQVTTMNMFNGNGTSFCDNQNENISPMVSMSNSHSMCSIREAVWSDTDMAEHPLRTINDDHGNVIDKLVDLRKSLPPSTSLPLWLEQSGERRAQMCGRKISVPAKLMTPKRAETPRKYSLGTECFMLMFDLLPQSDVEIVSATKGVTLRGAIAPPLERRGIPVSSIDVFLSSSNTPLPLDVDSYPLGGNQLHVKAKEGSDPHPGRQGNSMTAKGKSSVNQKDRDRRLSNTRGRKSCPEDNISVTSDTSPYNTMVGSEKMKMTKNASKFKDLFTQSTKTQKQEQLMEKLRQYSTQSLPAMPGLLTIGQKVYLDEIFEIESDWKQIVANPESLSKQKRDQQEAVWELLHTEVSYIKKVKVIIDLFMSCLINLQNEQILNEIETEKIFSNISEIYQVNCAFWELYLLPVLKRTRETRQQLDPSMLKEGFLKFEELFSPYKKYCLEQKNAIEYIREKYMESDLFKTFIMWAESQKPCERLTIRAMIVMPMQRLTKYKLLLKAILKKTDKDDHPKDLILTIQRVDVFVAHVNTALHQKQEHERLSMIIDKIETYDIIDFPSDETMKLVNEFCRFDLTCPIPGCPQQRRNLLREGALRLKEKDSKMDVYCFLFTDMLLITKLVTRKGDKVKVIKPPMRLDKVSIQQLRDGVSCVLVYLNEYHVASGLYTLQGDTRPWVDHITRAQAAYKQLRMEARDRSELHLMYMDSDGDEDSAVFNNMGFSDTTPRETRGSLVRQDSSCSVDMYIPSEGRQGTDSLTSAQHRLMSMGSDDTETYGESRLWYMGEAMAASPHFTSDTQFRFNDTQMSGKPSVKPKPCLKWGSASQLSKSEQTRSASSLSADWTRPSALPSRPDAIFLTDENVRTKLNQRRNMRTEKRYYTADAIQDLQKDRDPSIHKRLSWNLGAVDINIEERMANITGKTRSSESVRSMPSSSGVSSTASLHASPDADDVTEMRISDGVVDVDQGVGTEDSDLVRLSKHFSESSMDQPTYPQQLIGQSKTASNSMPDISQLIAAGELQNGIASVELPHGQRRQMSHAQILRMTKQLLLNSTLEASQV